jgi:hypothetical protein
MYVQYDTRLSTFQTNVLPPPSEPNVMPQIDRFAYSSTPKMEAVRTFETLVNFYRTTRSHFARTLSLTIRL